MLGRYLLEQACKVLGIAAPTSSDLPPATPARPLGAPSVDAVLAPHSALVRRIRVAYGHRDHQFEQQLFAPITGLASWLHFIPGHPGGGFERPGGAIEQALTNCLFSLQAADGRIFDGSDTEAPSIDTTQRWRLACALGGLFVSLRELLTTIEVASEDGDLWPAAAMPLLHWLESLGATKYHYRWTSIRSVDHLPSVYVASRCIDPAVMSFLGRGDARIPAAMLRSIAGLDRSVREPISDVVNTIAVAVAARERPQGAFAATDLIALTLKRLLTTSDWLPNSPGGHVWFGADGLYLLWPDAGTKILESVPRSMRGSAGFASHGALLGHMAADGIICASPSSLFHIRAPGQVKPQGAVRVADPDRILKELGLRATPLDLQLCVSAPRTPTSAEDAVERIDIRDGVERRSSGTTMPSVNGELFTEEQQAECAEGPDALVDQPPSVPGPSLVLDTSKIANPRSREIVDGVISRLEQSFDTMLAKVVPAGVFVALAEFGGQNSDGASIVRALHDAGLLAVDASEPNRRVQPERIEGADVAGVVLSAEAFHGYSEWVARWQDESHNGHASPGR